MKQFELAQPAYQRVVGRAERLLAPAVLKHPLARTEGARRRKTVMEFLQPDGLILAMSQLARPVPPR